MKAKFAPSIHALAMCMLASVSTTAISQDATPEKAQALLADVKKLDLNRAIAAKRTEVQRYEEDLARRQKESESLQETINAISSAISETGSSLDQLRAQKARLTNILELTTLRIDAERLKSEGLKNLSDAQNKNLAAIARRIEELTVRNGIGTAELKLLEEKASADASDPKEISKVAAELAELKKKLLRSERATSSADRIAREAMSSASFTLQQADTAAIRASKRATDLDVKEVGSGPEEAEKVDPKIPTPKQ